MRLGGPFFGELEGWNVAGLDVERSGWGGKKGRREEGGGDESLYDLGPPPKQASEGALSSRLCLYPFVLEVLRSQIGIEGTLSSERCHCPLVLAGRDGSINGIHGLEISYGPVSSNNSVSRSQRPSKGLGLVAQSEAEKGMYARPRVPSRNIKD